MHRICQGVSGKCFACVVAYAYLRISSTLDGLATTPPRVGLIRERGRGRWRSYVGVATAISISSTVHGHQRGRVLRETACSERRRWRSFLSLSPAAELQYALPEYRISAAVHAGQRCVDVEWLCVDIHVYTRLV
jgi:hypothetical protein